MSLYAWFSPRNKILASIVYQLRTFVNQYDTCTISNGKAQEGKSLLFLAAGAILTGVSLSAALSGCIALRTLTELAFFFFRLADQAGNLCGLFIFVQSHHNDVGFVNQPSFTVQSFDIGFDANLHGSPAHIGNGTDENNSIVGIGGIGKFQRINGSSCDISAAVPPGGHRRNDVNPFHQLSAKQTLVAVQIALCENLNLFRSGLGDCFLIHNSMPPFEMIGLSIQFQKRRNPILGMGFWRREWDSNPRQVALSPVFKTGSLNHSDISPNFSKLYH